MTPLEALQATLAVEHAALYMYGVLGGRVSSSAEPALAADLRSAHDLHRERRDQLTEIVLTVGPDGTVPVAAEVSYELTTPARTAAQCRTAALDVERACAAAYATAVGSTSGANRQWAIDALEDAAVRGLRFGDEPVPYPGVPEL